MQARKATATIRSAWRKTDWHTGNGGPMRGIGQRLFLVGDEARSILELRQISFAPAEAEAENGENAN